MSLVEFKDCAVNIGNLQAIFIRECGSPLSEQGFFWQIRIDFIDSPNKDDSFYKRYETEADARKDYQKIIDATKCNIKPESTWGFYPPATVCTHVDLGK